MRAIVALLLVAVGADAADAARVVRGPWWWHAADGSPHVAVATAGRPQAPTMAQVDGIDVAIAGEAFALAGRSDDADHVLVLRFAAGTAGAARILIDQQPVAAHLHPPPAHDSAARIALAGGWAWPDRDSLTTLATALGGRPDLVLALGDGVPMRLGTGGWEADIPIAVVAPPGPDLSACTGGQDAAWRHGLRIGVLGLPASPDRGRADLALARDLSPWLVYLDVPAGWDPAIGRRHIGDPRDLGVLLAACQRLAVPLALGAGSAGLVSEPLQLRVGGAVEIDPRGVRYVLPIPAADDGLARIGPATAIPLEQPLTSGIAADVGELRLVMARPGEASAVTLSWRRGGDDADANPPTREVAAAESLDTPAMREAIRRWSWLPRQVLASSMPDPAVMARLRDEAGAQGRLLARRLALIAAEDASTQPPDEEPDPLLQRDLLLWRIGSVRGADAAGWRLHAAATTDPMALRALLADVARDPERLLLPVLIERVRMQALGELPLDPDPLDQHRLFATVFDDLRLSPTPLRPWAVALRERADALARGPIDRFIARHGTERPVP